MREVRIANSLVRTHMEARRLHWRLRHLRLPLLLQRLPHPPRLGQLPHQGANADQGLVAKTATRTKTKDEQRVTLHLHSQPKSECLKRC